MESNAKKIFILLIGGVPGIGKSFLSKKIIEFNNEFEIKYLNFDAVENINKDNYFQYQQMRDDYLNKIKEILESINTIATQSLLIILDDNFFLKSMRKKIYNSLIDKIIELNNDNLVFYYLEILLKPSDLNYCLKMNCLRDKNEQIPENIIINMNNIFEYNSPYLNNSQILILDINNEESINNNYIKEIFINIEKYLININKNNLSKEKNNVEKNYKAKLIDNVEDIIRKEISLMFKESEEKRKKGKEISKYKKEYMKILLLNIQNLENNNLDKSSNLMNALKDHIKIENINISQNKQLIELIKEDFKNFLIEKKI